jgi:acyl-CoA hydrolase
VFVNATPPDSHGFCSLGTSVEAMHAAIDAAKTVIVQFNRAMPRTLGESFIHVSQIDFAVEIDVPNLGIHTEMFTDPVVDLVEAGVITGDRKERNRGKLVTAFLMGSKRLYDFVDDNPMVEMRPVDFTNDTHVIRSFSRMVAINSAIEIDLTGQVVADSIGPRMYSGIGGQMDFIRGAGLAAEGRAIIALPSQASNGQSRIVPFLHEGAGVVSTRGHVRTVVTEWGVAELFGKSLCERARALIAIAHPDARDDLTDAARRRRLI